jgi:hypothetical protein
MADNCKPSRDLIAFLNAQLAKERQALQERKRMGSRPHPANDPGLEGQLSGASIALQNCLRSQPAPRTKSRREQKTERTLCASRISCSAGSGARTDLVERGRA